jgi:hypothetical protein
MNPSPTKIVYKKQSTFLFSQDFMVNGTIYYICINLQNRTYAIREVINVDSFINIHKTSYKSLKKAKEEIRQYLESLGVKFVDNFKHTIP